MNGRVTRRSLLAGALCAAVAGPRVSFAGKGVESSALADGAVLYGGVGCNVVAVRTAEGAVLVDTGSAASAKPLLRAVSDNFGRRVAAAFNTHWHHQNTGGNAAVIARGARVFAHENTRLWLSANFYDPAERRRYTPVAANARPTDTFHEGGVQTIGGVEVRYGYLPQAHTDGDIYVFFPQLDVLAVGDVVSVGTYPVLDYSTGGWVGGMADATQALLDVAGPDTRIVPGTGPVVGREHLVAQHRMLTTMRDRFIEMLKLGKSAREMLEERVTAEFDAAWGDPTRFVMSAYPGLWGHQNEFDGIT